MRYVIMVLASFFAAFTLMSADGQWVGLSDDDWSDSSNWSDGVIASGSSYTAFFTASGSGAINVNNDLVALALGGITLGGSGFILTGNGLLMDADGAVQVLSADHIVALPLVLHGNLNYNLAYGCALEQSGSISGDGGITLNGGKLVLSATANSYTGGTKFITGTLKFSDPTQLGTSSVDPMNLVLGDGTLHYTGNGDTMSRGLTIDAAPTTFDKASAIRVDGDLEISGAFNALSGATIKTGPGTLHLTYPGEHVVNEGLQSAERNTNITYNADGSAGSAGFASFTLEQGNMIISGADQLATFNGDAFVGARTLYSPEFIVSNATVHSLGGWWSIGRGTGTTADPQSPSIKLLDGAYMNIQGSGLVLGNAEGNNEYLCYPKLLVDNSHLKVDKISFISENSNAHPTIMVTNNAHFENSSDVLDNGLDLSKNGGDTLMTVSDNSVLSAYYLAVNQNADLIVEKGSEARLQQTCSQMPARINGNLYFDDATLRPYISALAPNWLMGMPTVNVRSGGLTIDVDTHAYLDAKLIEDAADSGGAVVKTGNGTLAMRLPECDFEVQAGSILLAGDDPLITAKDVGTISTAIGTTLEVSGQRALVGVTLPSGTALNLRSHSLSQFKKAWTIAKVAGNAIVRGDGLLQLCDNAGGRAVAYLYEKQEMTGAWAAEFDYYGFSTYPNPADGISFIIHNDPRGLNAVGGGANYLGYAGPSDTAISNSVAVGIDVFNKYLRLGVDGNWVDQIPFSSDMPHLTLLNDKVRCRVAYDGIGTLTVKLSHPQFGFFIKSFNVDIAQALETDDAYVGFGCGTGGSKGQHMIGGFTLNNGVVGYLPDYSVVGGMANIGSGDLKVIVGASQAQRGYQMESLTYADQAELEIISATASNAQPELSLANQDSWKLLGEAHWLPDGRLANSAKVKDGQGSSYTYDSFDLLSRSWQLSFSFDMGDRTPTAADALHLFMMKDDPAQITSIGPPGDACRFEWRYYYNAPEHPTILRIYTNSVQDLVVPDMAPIDLQVDNTAQMTLSYDQPSDTMTIRTESNSGDYTHVITNFNLPQVLYNSDVYIGFWGQVGGAQCENIVGDLSLVYTDGEDFENGATHYLAFNELNGSGTLIKSGSGALALPGDVDAPTGNAVIEVREGGIVLGKRALEPAALGGSVRSDWISGYLGEWGKDGSFQVSPALNSARSTAHYGRRICVSRAWTIEYDFFMDDKSGSPADAYCIFVHNDPRGVMALGDGTGNAGYGGSANGIRNSLAMRWYFYQGNKAGLPNTTEIGWDGIFKAETRQSFDPIRLANGITHTTISYDPVVGTLRSVLSNGGSVVTNTYTDVNIAAQVGGEYAWLGFGGGSGGAFCDMCINNLSMTYHEDVPDPTDQSDYLAELIVPAASTAPVYLHRTVDRELNYQIGKVTLNEGATLKVDYAHDSAKTAPATLVARELNFQSVGIIDVQSGARCALRQGSGVDLIKVGGGTLEFAPADIQPLSYSGSTTLAEGALLLSGAYLPESTALAVTNGATLNLQFIGKQYVDTLTVDGVECNGGLYSAANTSWIEGPGLLVVRNPAPGSQLIIK